MKNIVSYETVIGTSRCRKTTMCYSVNTDSPCPHGDKCQFAHNESELKPVHRHNELFKTRMCHNASNCSFADKCRFAHDPSELRVPPCRFGDKCERVNCKFSHPTSSVVVETADVVLAPPIKVAVPKWIAALQKTQPVKPKDAPTCIKVHKDMAMEVFKKMLERGETSISFELI